MLSMVSEKTADTVTTSLSVHVEWSGSQRDLLIRPDSDLDAARHETSLVIADR